MQGMQETGVVSMLDQASLEGWVISLALLDAC